MRLNAIPRNARVGRGAMLRNSAVAIGRSAVLPSRTESSAYKPDVRRAAFVRSGVRRVPSTPPHGELRGTCVVRAVVVWR